MNSAHQEQIGEGKESLVQDQAAALKPDAPEFVPQEQQYNAFKAEVPAAYRAAMDAIYGLPFGGSLAFIGQNGEGLTEWKAVGQGPAYLQMTQGEIAMRGNAVILASNAERWQL